jgi:hypothetical protein
MPLAEHKIENLVRQIGRLLDSDPREHCLEVDPQLSGQQQPSDDARAQVDQRPTQTQHAGIRVEH